MKVLVLAAHPDDEALGCGGTIKKLSENNDVRVMTFTDGGGARDQGSDRRHELEMSSEILGFRVLDMFNFPDNQLDTVPLLEVNKKVENSLKKNDFVPDVIITHSPWCLNVDHKKVFEVTQVISRLLKCKIMCFEVPSSSEWNNVSEFKPNCHVELSQVHVEAKLQSLRKCYSNEMREDFHPRSYNNILNLSKVHGSVIGVEYAERFMIVKEVL